MNRRDFFLMTGGLAVVPALGQDKPRLPERFNKDIERFEKMDLENPPAKGAVLFLGSSSIRRWSTMAEDFEGIAVTNRGFGGSEISDQLHFFDRIVPQQKPRKIVMFCGENDVWNGKKAERVYADFRAFVAKVDKALPGVPIGFIELKPSPARIGKWPEYQKTNGLIRAYAADHPMVSYFDVSIDMLDEIGEPRPELFVSDKLHLTKAGYDLWSKRVQGWVSAPP